MEINILRRVPVHYHDGSIIRRDPLLSLTAEPHWDRIDGIGVGLSVQRYKLVLAWPFHFMLQLHVAKYGVGDQLSEHIDYATGRLWRVQIVLRNAVEGGELLCEHFILNHRHFKIFEPCKYRHEVTKVKQGERVVLNFGLWLARRYTGRCESTQNENDEALEN